MPVTLDCGDICTITLNIQVGVATSPNNPLEDEIQDQIIRAIQKTKEKYEKQIAEELASESGFPEELRTQLVAERDERLLSEREAEEKGRAEKNKKRAGNR